MPGEPTATLEETATSAAPGTVATSDDSAAEPRYDSEDALLDKMLGSDGPETPDTESRKPAEVRDTAKPEAKTEPKPEAKPDHDDSAEGPPAFRKYAQALELDGYPREHALRLAQSDPAAFEKFGRAAAKRQADTNRLMQETAELRKAKEQQADRREPEGQPDDDLDKMLQPFVAEFGEQGAKALKPLLKAQLDRTKSLEAKLTRDLSSRVDYLNKRTLEIDTSNARSQLKAEWPQLEDDDVFTGLDKEMRRQALRGDYDNLQQLMDDTALLKYGRSTIKDLRTRLGELHQKRTNGQPTPPTRSPASGATTTKVDPEDEALDKILGS